MKQEAGNWKPYNTKSILKNIETVYKTGDIEKLSNASYSFIILLSGFIAHYNLWGFMDHYKDLRDFSSDLISACNKPSIDYQRNDSDFIKWYGVDYCNSKADIMEGIIKIVNQYHISIDNKQVNEDVEKLQNLVQLTTEILKRNDPQLTKALVNKLEL